MPVAMRFVFLLSMAVACTPPAPPPGSAGPLEAAQAFSAAVQKGDSAAAWSLLTPRSRDAVDARAEAARKAAGGPEPEGGRQMLFNSALPQGASKLTLVEESGDTAQVSDGAHRFRLRRESGRWLLDLDLPDAGAAR